MERIRIIDKDSINYLERYVKVTDDIKKRIERHAKRYEINAEICAWYKDWNDFCSEWCDELGFTKTEARKLLHGGIGEFIYLPDNLGIVRFSI